MLNKTRQLSISYRIAHATALKQQGHYAAAKSLLKPLLAEHPAHLDLQLLYQRIESLQQKKIKQRH